MCDLDQFSKIQSLYLSLLQQFIPTENASQVDRPYYILCIECIPQQGGNSHSEHTTPAYITNWIWEEY